MKILLICEYFPSTVELDIHGGVEHRAYDIATLLSYKHTVTVLASREISKPTRQVLQAINIIRAGLERSYVRQGDWIARVSFIVHAIFQGLQHPFNLVEGSSFIGWLPAYLLSRIKQKKCVLVVADTVDSFISGIPQWQLRLLRTYERWLLKRADRIICISHIVKAKLLKLGIQGKKIKVIYCSVNIHEIESLKASHKRPFSICCIARLVPYKRVEDLIYAVYRLKPEFPLIRLHITGDGEETSFLKNMVKILQLSASVRFYGHISQHKRILKMIKHASIFCLPSVVEGFGIVTIEALSAQTPVILADIPVNHEITQGKGVVFFTPRDVQSLAIALKKLFRNPDLYHKLQREAKQVAKTYDSRKIIAQTEKLYEDMCNY